MEHNRSLWAVTLDGEPVALVSADGREAAVSVALKLMLASGRPAQADRLAARPPRPAEAEIWAERAGGIAGEVALAGFILEGAR
jgi:hypothetical protein